MPQIVRPDRVWAVLIAALLTVSGCDQDKPTPPASFSTHPATGSPAAQPPSPPPAGSLAAQPPAQSSVPTAEVSGAPPGTRTCSDLTTAITRATLMDPGVVARIAAASATADAPVADAAQRLAAAYAKAAISKGTSQEPDAVAAVSAAAADMAGVCEESGLESVG
jgi:hypothetical protein